MVFDWETGNRLTDDEGENGLDKREVIKLGSVFFKTFRTDRTENHVTKKLVERHHNFFKNAFSIIQWYLHVSREPFCAYLQIVQI